MKRGGDSRQGHEAKMIEQQFLRRAGDPYPGQLQNTRKEKATLRMMY